MDERAHWEYIANPISPGPSPLSYVPILSENVQTQGRQDIMILSSYEEEEEQQQRVMNTSLQSPLLLQDQPSSSYSIYSLPESLTYVPELGQHVPFGDQEIADLITSLEPQLTASSQDIVAHSLSTSSSFASQSTSSTFSSSVYALQQQESSMDIDPFKSVPREDITNPLEIDEILRDLGIPTTEEFTRPRPPPLHPFFVPYRHKYSNQINPVDRRYIVRVPQLVFDRENTLAARGRSGYFYVKIVDPEMWPEYDKKKTSRRIVDLYIHKHIDTPNQMCRVYFYALGWTFGNYPIPTVNGIPRFNVANFIKLSWANQLKDFTIASGGRAVTLLWKKNPKTGRAEWIQGKKKKKKKGSKIEESETIIIEGNREMMVRNIRSEEEDQERVITTSIPTKTGNIERIT